MKNDAINQLKAMYAQLFNLNEQIKNSVANGEIDTAVQKSSQLDNLMSQIKFARMGLTISEENKNEISELETKAVVEIKYTMESLIKIKDNVKGDLNKVNNNIKVKNAYTAEMPRTGQILFKKKKKNNYYKYNKFLYFKVKFLIIK